MLILQEIRFERNDYSDAPTTCSKRLENKPTSRGRTPFQGLNNTL